LIQYFKKLSSHTLIYGFGEVIVRAVGFLLIPLYTRFLTTDDYGVWSLLQTFQLILILVLGLGFTSAVFKVYHETKDEKEKDRVVSTALLFLLAWGLPVTLVLSLSAVPLSRMVFGSVREAVYLRYVFVAVFLDLVRLVALALLRAREKPVSFSIINLIHFILLVSLNILNVAVRKQGILGIVESQVATSFLIALGVGIVFLRRIGLGFSRTHLRALLDFGLPLVPSGVSIWGLTMTAQYFIHFYGTDHDVGLYALGMRFGMILNILLVRPFRTAWLPFMFSIRNEERARRVYSLTLTYFFMGGMGLYLLLSVLSREIVQLAATTRFIEGHRVIPLIALAYLFYGLYYTADAGVMLSGKTRYYALVTAIAAVFQLVCNFIIVPKHGMIGAAWVVLASFVLLFGMILFVAQRLYPIRYEGIRLGKIAFSGVLVYGVSRLIQPGDLALAFCLKGIWLLSYPVWLWIFRFYTPQEKAAVRGFIKKHMGSERR
jgi:O-antigen/teichoic acid export membrane protein